MNRTLKIFFSIILLILLIAQTGYSQVRLPRLVSDGMILQREAPVKIWGWASAGEKVKISFNNQSFETVTPADGKWLITLPAQKAGGPFEIKITGSNQIILKDILFGDIWLCSGQSNMETTMGRVSPLYGKDIETCANPNIRLFQVPVRWNYNKPQEDIQGGKWETANPQNILKYTAVGYFFARDLYEKYKVPVGIIQCAAGGSSAESWISEESLKAFPEQYKIAKQLSDTTYLKNLLSSEKTAQWKWFDELGKSDLGRKGMPWLVPQLDDSAWPTLQIPSSFREAGMDFKSGTVWFRKEIELPESSSGKQALLELGTIIDSDSVFINGKFVGTTGYQYPPRRYNVASGILKSGKNNITVSVVSQSGNGAFIKEKPYQLTVEGQTFDLKGTWKYNIGAKCGPSPSSTFFPGKPLGLYNAMLSPIVNYTLKGMVWYQGESNAERAHEYKTVLSTLISEWRALWGQGNLPFLFVQLPDFMEPKTEPSEGSWASLRYQQLKTLSVPNTAMAVTIGLGEKNDIHPLRKKEVGQRLALAAEKLAYGDTKVVASGPMYQSMKVKGNKIELSFSDCGSGLTTNDGKELKHFSIAGADGKFVWAKGEIKGNKVIVWNESIPNPAIVRYAWADNPAGANLYNKEGLPASPFTTEKNIQRERISINEGWSFFKYESATKADNLIYDVRPEITDNTENKVADAKPTEAVEVKTKLEVLKPWILPSGNDFIKDPAKRHIRPVGNPGGDFPFVQNNFDDHSWEKVNLPHDWAIKGPFQKGWNSEVGGGMGRLPVNGVAWYRKKLDIPASDAGKSFFLDIDGAMSYAIVWLNGQLVGGWPYGYNSFRLDLTPFIKIGEKNQLAIRIDNPNHSARWYPGAGLYRNVWLTKTNPIHIGQWGTYVTTKAISKESATIHLAVSIDNKTKTDATVEVSTSVYALDAKGNKTGKSVASFASMKSKVGSEGSAKLENSVTIKNPKLWGPPPTQQPNLYVAETTLSENGKIIDTYETRFGIRSVEFNPDKGIFVNGEHIKIQGVNQHHDLGALGSAFNTRAAERQLEILREMGCNAIRMAHNPPAPELLELTDRMGFLVIDEIFDSWERKKTPHDFHLIFPDWSEADTRSFIRRDRNCPSVIMWSFGNEVGEQYTDKEGAAVAKRLYDFVKEEDSTRPTTLAMNFAKSDMPLPQVPDVIGLNYQGEGIRQNPEFEGTDRIRTAPQYDAFHAKFPNKVILSAETASAFSSRGIYLFPVSKENSAPVRDGRGGDSKICQVSSYELHAVDFGSSADKVFGSLDRHPFVAGEFVWNGFDYIGEPTPYYEARSSYSGIIDLAGFKKDRFYLYQSRWRPELPMAHILPHWNWYERVGEVTPVHVFTSGDEAELFLNGKSLGKKKKGAYEYRLRWDDVKYEPGELKVVAYKNGAKWAEEIVKTTEEASQLQATADRGQIVADGKDLTFITVKITDKDGLMVPRSNNRIEFSIDGPGEIVATDNGDSYNLESFASHQREAFNGLALVIVRAKAREKGTITVIAKSSGLMQTQVKVKSK